MREISKILIKKNWQQKLQGFSASSRPKVSSCNSSRKLTTKKKNPQVQVIRRIEDQRIKVGRAL